MDFLKILNQLQLGELEVREVWGNGFSNRSGISGLRHPLSRAILSQMGEDEVILLFPSNKLWCR